jgi:hypothetical protein
MSQTFGQEFDREPPFGELRLSQALEFRGVPETFSEPGSSQCHYEPGDCFVGQGPPRNDTTS